MRAGVDVSRVTQFESGRSVPQWRTLRKLVGVLGVGLVDVDSSTPPLTRWP